MRKILIIGVVALVVFGLVRFKILNKSSLQTLNKTLQTKAKQTSQGVLGLAVKQVQTGIFSAAASVNTMLDEKTQSLLGSNNGSFVASVSALTSTHDIPLSATPIVFDFTAPINESLTLNRETVYYFDVRNVPEKFCLFIQSHEYHLEKSQLLKVSFASAGTYDVSFNFCHENSTKFGEIVVK